jgi:chemotaxis-related protein WspB
MLMLLFYIGSNVHAIESSYVVEVIPRVTYREVYHVPNYVAGLFNYRGAIVPVIDLCQLIRGTSSQSYLSTRVFIVSYPAQESDKLKYVGLMAERVIKTVKKSAGEFLASGIQTSEAPYLGKMIMDESGMIQHINLEHLLSILKKINLLTSGL